MSLQFGEGFETNSLKKSGFVKPTPTPNLDWNGKPINNKTEKIGDVSMTSTDEESEIGEILDKSSLEGNLVYTIHDDIIKEYFPRFWVALTHQVLLQN